MDGYPYRNQQRKNRRLTGLLVAALLWGAPHFGLAQEDEIIAGGRLKYEKYCASCHGMDAKGNGEMARWLTIKPTDLTQLSKHHKGEFPFWSVYRMIDGRETVRGHGSREMPIWGFVFQVEEGADGTRLQEDLVRGRIWQLVYYLASIQEK
jgi:mono/diheme cytochrome c family protein